MLNQIIIHGRLTNDPSMQIKNGGNGSAILPFAIANDNYYNNTKTTMFFNCVAFNANAQFIVKHFKKGSEIIIIGRLQARSYETQDGEKRNVCEIVVNSVEFVGGYKGTQETTPQESTTEPHHEEPKKSFADTLRAAAIKPTPKVKSVAQFFDATPPPQEPPAKPEEQPDEPRGELPFEI
ncbi:MAG: single-stranded DNA-binding protein [Alphaproteobacteria bacterium]|nr:single-stranded DNA-binding protein [Alphaproteobacteria bacterium]MBR6502586.1 single-stranded DNA-binding protein [Clostridia bacterium]